MKKSLLFAIIALLSTSLHAQVTRLVFDKDLDLGLPLPNGKVLMISALDQTLWVTDGTPEGTIQLSSTIMAGEGAATLNGKYIFPASTDATGSELFITDGTIAGTHIIKDIVSGPAGSDPDEELAVLNGIVYFTATTPDYGRELWKTDGTSGGTVLVKDIIDGPGDSNVADEYELFSNGSYLLFSARTASSGVELYKSDGTAGGTGVLADINTGAASSDAGSFYPYNNMVLFLAKTEANGIELWKTNGTPGGTSIVKDIYTGPANSITIPLFLPFNGKLLFTADNGVNGEELWITDGTPGNTHILKDINPGEGSSAASLFSAIKVGSKLIFTASDASISFGSGLPDYPTNSELWETDGTEAGTHIFKEIVAGDEGSFPFIFAAFDYATGAYNTPLFQGNKFFLMANTPDNGYELWISDGTSAGTHLVKDINPDEEDGIVSPSFFYTSTALYFSATDGVSGNELWKSDGTEVGTVMVADININDDPEDSDSDVQLGMIVNNKLIFTATDGDGEARDLFRLDGTFSPLPLKLGDFTVTPANADAILQWTTLSELNTRDFSVQRSDNAMHFTQIGTVAAAGNSNDKRTYRFTDAGIMNSGKEVVYYKLVMSDKDGSSVSSKVIAVKIKAAAGWNVKLLTNPVRTDAEIVFSGVSKNAKLSIKDLTGKTIFNQVVTAANGRITLPVAQLMPGVYVLVAESNNERQVIKFIKQ